MSRFTTPREKAHLEAALLSPTKPPAHGNRGAKRTRHIQDDGLDTADVDDSLVIEPEGGDADMLVPLTERKIKPLRRTGQGLFGSFASSTTNESADGSNTQTDEPWKHLDFSHWAAREPE